MSFSAEWLALREPYDRQARSARVLKAAGDAFGGRPAVNVVDLACGTGSTLRAVCPHLPPRQNWTLVDNDLSLLARAAPERANTQVSVRTMPLDISLDLEAALDGAVELVTTSALLDLVSAGWLERFAVEIAARRLPVYAALSYDGRVAFGLEDALDASVIAAVNRHQLTDKGFGPALGPAAADFAIARFERLGYAVTRDRSDWVLVAGDARIQTEIVVGWAAAARAVGGPALADLAAWLKRRTDQIAEGRSHMTVGHVDFFAIPSAR